MKYNQPWDKPTDANAVYVNGNPATGTNGSIPPAESIEYPQREIVAVIQYAYDKGFFDYNNNPCAVPANTDLTQLLKAIYGIMGRRLLTQNVDLYVNPATGSDSYDGSAAAHGAGLVGPFLTLTKAFAVVGQFSPGVFGATIHLSAGTYSTTVGYGTSNWAHCNVHLDGAGSSTILTASGTSGTVLSINGPNFYTLTNMLFNSTSTYNGTSLINVTTAAVAVFGGGITLGGCTTAQQPSGIYAGNGLVGISGSVTIAGTFGFSGSYGGVFVADGSGAVLAFNNSCVITISTAMTCAYFAEAVINGEVACSNPGGPTFVNRNNVTGVGFLSEYNGVVFTQTGNQNFFPGTTGIYTLGGQWN